ncbi:Glycerophosphoryl diester phosphodiesterase family-domain-containing protein [Stachybotrys elegans]|uniref:Glycerophosphoryl diester phosphodiesterase family-domain-containing protein n=1 Tax=Stachybotrys elegans TaxID=80388 RepID=A0A8K0SHU8_9HYPO|nr:Glycerophosphoryl diester phosphodiesterase family-domain-containing protein [Stachybotrys elegans]
MRFGSQLYQYQRPAWVDFYVDYNRLKTLVDAGPSLQELRDAIHSEIDIARAFMATEDRHIEARILALEEQWGVRIDAEPSDFRGVSRLELEDLHTSLMEIASQLTECHDFARVNRDGISRILDKAVLKYPPEEISKINALPRLAQHDRHLCNINSTLQHLKETLVHNQSTRLTRSLLLERSGLDCFPAHRCLEEDDAPGLEAVFDRHYPEPSPATESAMNYLFQAALLYKSLNCQRKILMRLQSDPNQKPQGYLLKGIQSLARSDPRSEASSAEPLEFLMLLSPSQQRQLQSSDILGRSPLHYVALFGLDGACCQVISMMQNSGSKISVGTALDVFGLTPIDYAVRRGHTAVVELLMAAHDALDHGDELQPLDKSDLLAVAIASRYIQIARLLINKGWGTKFVRRSGRNVLHVAAEQGLSELVKDIVACGVDVNAQDKTRSWTPLTIASVHGHLDTVKALILAGADTRVPDHREWLAIDYAAYRGHMGVVNTIQTKGSEELQSKPGRQLSEVNILRERSPSDSIAFVHIGTLDLYKKVKPVDMAPYHKYMYPNQIPESSFELAVSIAEARGQNKHTVSLPLLSENSDWPLCFRISDPGNVAVIFKITDLLNGSVVGTGIALVSSLTASLGPKRDTLIRDYTVALVSDKIGLVGTVIFTIIIARPYNGVHPPPAFVQTLTRGPSSYLGGHRGNGQNDNSGCLQIGENTIKSFLTAVELGADVVELDVQLTKDDVPVVYHDFLVVEKGSDAPMHTLTYDQFMGINEAQSTSKDMLSKKPPLGRRASLCEPLDMDALVSQMKHTLNYPGYKPNLRNHSIHEPFITLVDLFRGLPEDIPLDIELKYPMLYEAADFQMDNYATEINLFLDTILSVVYAHAGSRRLIFSSFSPDICMVLAVKQQIYPMLFLNDSSNWPTGDMRATSLQTAMRFAHRFGLAGVAMSSEPFVHSPGLVNLAKRQGLYTATYGPLNDVGASVEIQAKAGVDLIIVNKVGKMSQVLDKFRKRH